jgi:hypothetical protein
MESAKLTSAVVGSAPTVSTKMSAVIAVESS